MKNNKIPYNKKFIFTIIDDTDDAFLENIVPIYDLLHKNNIITTKTVWVYPPRDITESKGDSLQREEYLSFIKDIKKKGFEIGLHNVGSGDYTRNEIINGLEEFNEKLGFYPSLHVNHSYNKDNIYSGSKRFSFPLNWIVKFFYSHYDTFFGDTKGSDYFWGDYHKKHIKYGRNYEIDGINTIKKMPNMPYKDKIFDEYANYWFASTFASNQWLFNYKINEESIDKLESDSGICILYTHLGYFMQNGEIDKGFERMINYIGKKDGWFVPVSEVMEFLLKEKKSRGESDNITLLQKKKIEFHSFLTRIKYRFIIKIDDYHFKKSNSYAK
jgi:hypothetical protein